MHGNVIEHEFRRLGCTACGTTIDVPVACGNRFCPVCNGNRRRKIKAKLQHVIKNASVPPGYRWRFITLTIPTSDDLRDAAKTLVASFRRLRQRRSWSKRVAGGAYVIEVIGTPGNWHAHLHILVLSAFIPQKQLASDWSKCSPGRIVYIQLIPPSAIIHYVTKYVTKTDLKPEFQLQASNALKGFRLFQPFGSLHLVALSAPRYDVCCSACGNNHFVPLAYSTVPWLSKRLIDVDGFPDPWKNQKWGQTGT